MWKIITHMTTQDKVKVIAEYDGMSTFKTEHDLFFKRGFGCTPENYDYHLLHLKYLTSLDWLHPVAMKVLDKLRKIEAKLAKEYENEPMFVNGTINEKKFRARKIDLVYARSYSILLACQVPATKGEYIDLFNAVYDGIVFLKSNK